MRIADMSLRDKKGKLILYDRLGTCSHPPFIPQVKINLAETNQNVSSPGGIVK